MNKLWVRLALAFLLVSVLSVGIVAAFANRQVDAQFQRYVIQSRVTEQGWEDALASYYRQTGSLAGAEALLDAARPARGFGASAGGNGMMLGRTEVIVADDQGRVVAPDSLAGAALSASERDLAVPVVVDGRSVGFVLARAPGAMQLTGAAQAFLAQINQSLLQAALVAALVGAALGLILARGVSQPLSALAAAARRVARGHLDERVPVRGSAEVAGVAEAFNEMTSALQRNEALRRNLAADVAHELRTPLTVMQGNLRAILDDVYPLAKHEVALVYDETLTLGRLVNDLRDLSLAEAGQLSLNLSPLPLGPALERAALRWREMFSEKGVALDLRVADELPDVRMDPERLAQVLNNLLANALRHTPNGGRVVVQADLHAGAVRTAVMDTGPGIPPEDLPHVFDRFWRREARGPRRDGEGGSGLGLAIARQFVEAMGGRIGVTSEPGAGACFWFTLPADARRP